MPDRLSNLSNEMEYGAVSKSIGFLLCFAGLLSIAGCSKPVAKKIDKPRTKKEVTGRWNSVRGNRGQSTRPKYKIDGEEFEALWEITRVIGGKIKLQLQINKPWEKEKIYRAVRIVLTEEPDQPWFYPIEETLLPCLRRALLQISDEPGQDRGSSIGGTPEMPYDCVVKVIDRKGSWFVELTATLAAWD